MAFHVSAEADEVMSEINVTPLVDVMLVLLVVFLVTAPLLTNTVRVNLPQTARTSPTVAEPRRNVSLSIDAAGKVYVDKREITVAQVEPELKSLRAAHPELSVSLNADKAVNYGLVAKAMTAVDRAGITRLSVLTIGE
jgi:biopolymer transport protein ExbD